MHAIEANTPITIQAWTTEEPPTAQAQPIGPITVEAQPVEEDLVIRRFIVAIENLTPTDQVASLKTVSLLASFSLLAAARKVSLFALKAFTLCVLIAKSPLGDSFRRIVPFSFLASPTIQSALICFTVCSVTALACHYLSSRCFVAAFDVYRSNHATAQKMIEHFCEYVISCLDNYDNANFEANCQIIGANPIEVAALITDIFFLSHFTYSFTQEQREEFSRLWERFKSECLNTPTERAGTELFERLTAMKDTLLQTP